MDIDFQKESFYQLDRLDILARQVVEGFMIGLHKSPFHGFSVEFAEHRLHNLGDNIKDIDWKVYARTDRMYVKKFEEETNLRCQIVLDASSSMYFPAQTYFKGYNKIEFSAVSTAALMYMLRKQRDAVGLTVFDENIRFHTTAKVNLQHHKLLQNHLYQLLKEKNPKHNTSLSKSLHHVADALPMRSVIVIFSDAISNFEDNEALFNAFQHLKHNKHEVLFFNVLYAKQELELDFPSRPMKFVDIETGEIQKIHAGKIKAMYSEAAHSFRNELSLKCAQYNIDFVDADIEKGFEQVLMTYLVKRSKLL